MDERELEKILRSFDRVKAPRALDDRLSHYLTTKKKGRMRYALSFAALAMIILAVIYAFSGEKKLSGFLYDPLYAAVTVPGYFETQVALSRGESLKVIVDGEVIMDTLATSSDTVKLEFDTSPGLHYILIHIRDAYGNEEYARAIDIYSL